MTQQFKSTETFKMALTIIVDPKAKQWDYIRTDYGFGYIPNDEAAYWVEKYDIVEDGDNKGRLEHTRHLFEAATPLAVRKECLNELEKIKKQMTRANYELKSYNY